MLLDARIPMRIATRTADGRYATLGHSPADIAAPDAWTVLVACMADRASLQWPVAGWAAVSVLPSNRLASSADVAPTGHATGCACCTVRSPLAVLLSELFQQRARGTLPLFRRVLLVISAPAEGSVRRMVTDDRLVSALFRLEQQQATN